MTRRAEALVAAYGRIFPDRPRSKDFTSEETMQLMEAAAGELEIGGDHV